MNKKSTPKTKEKSVPTTTNIDKANASIDSIKKEIGKVVIGQDDVIENALITIIAGGHCLLVGLPGLAKTLLVETMGTVMGLSEQRVQFTPDLMPSDILGSEVLEENDKGKRTFRFIKGPIFSQLLMADEINRASPRTQSALLQAMQEKIVTVAGKSYDLPAPFHVLATQNPIEQEGTYPLPEAQLDRFFMQINVDYPSIEAERQVLINTTGNLAKTAKKIIEADDLKEIQSLVRDIPVGEKVVNFILKLVRAARPAKDSASDILWGPGPRASQALMLGVKAKALIDGRLSPSIEDVIHLAQPILRHRMALSFAARAEGISTDAVIQELIRVNA